MVWYLYLERVVLLCLVSYQTVCFLDSDCLGEMNYLSRVILAINIQPPTDKGVGLSCLMKYQMGLVESFPLFFSTNFV